LFAVAEVRTAGRGGLVMLLRITGLARSTINRGKRDLEAQPLPKGQVRRAGGGRRSVCENDPGLVPALKRLVEPATLGEPFAGVAARDAGELTFEGGDCRPTLQPRQFGRCGGQCRVAGLRRTVDDEGCAR
jgi:hypothetical protein